MRVLVLTTPSRLTGVVSCDGENRTMPPKKAAKPSLKSILVSGALGRSSKPQKAAKTSHLAVETLRGKLQQTRRDKRG